MSPKTYKAFLESKEIADPNTGLEVNPKEINKKLFQFQNDIVVWAVRRGRAAIFADCGLGKTIMQLEWARLITEKTGGKVIIFAPLAVSRQTIVEGKKFGIEVHGCRSQEDVKPGINITNYQVMHKFMPTEFVGIVLDESSILKGLSGKYKEALIEFAGKMKYRLACTATPAPNDYMEIGNHSEFLGAMTHSEMLSMFFVHDGGDTSKWRIKGHGRKDFWKWICTWAVNMRKPSDLGYDDDGFILPKLNIKHITVDTGKPIDGFLFAIEAKTLDERRKVRGESVGERAGKAKEIINQDKESKWLIWCNLNSESQGMKKILKGAIEITGSDSDEHKEKYMLDFAGGDTRVIISKPSLCGFGMNFQRCHNVVFLGLSDSYEQYYQAVRRCWRFGQKKPVNVYIITSNLEGEVIKNIQRKEREATEMSEKMVENMASITRMSIKGMKREEFNYKTDTVETDKWTAHLGDSCEKIKEIKTESIHYSVYSPPFSSLYSYTNSIRDFGNSKNDEMFYEHFSFLAKELLRVLKPGRLMSVHCMNLPSTKQHNGYIGVRDFRGELINLFTKCGFIYHSEVCIWKDPVTAMQRTKALGLLHKQIRKDAAMCRQGIPDYLCTFRKPGENPERVTNTQETFPVKLWQKYDSPIWTDINQSNTMSKKGSREDDDERHICPLQLDVIERAVKLWSNPGDLVFSPFMGIGSEGYVSLKMGRRFVGIELKESYYRVAIKHLEMAVKESGTLF